ncbi:protein dead ringer isoform X1 [Drosophila willistoni]|uniref:protein dead ringer isoform X1 n=1 Tax=Drosophila willistoni TaxID=7260 RepID=UPI000C26C385|nr:protein dead ringer isoform X1 [Drosophila willistoni]
MQLRVHPTMDCSGRSNNIERDSDLGDDLSHGDRTDDEMRDCDSVDGEQHQHQLSAKAAIAARLSHTVAGGQFAATGGEQQAELALGHHHPQLPPNHPLNALGNFMGIGGLHSIPNLQHSDVLEKLKMQVRDMKVGLMEQDYAAAAHAAAFGANMLPTTISSAFPLPHNSVAAVAAAAATFAPTSVSNGASYNGGGGGNSISANNTTTNGAPGGGGGGGGSVSGTSSMSGAVSTGGGSHPFSFASPTAAPSAKEATSSLRHFAANSASNSSTSSEASNSSQQNNGWSFEEQYKQVRQLYEINDDPKRKEFLDDLFSFMQKRGTPINRLPIMAKSVLDLYELYNLVIARGGLVDVINKKLWQEIIKGLHLPSSITSAAFTLRTQYMKYLYPYECEKKNLSTPAELQAAIDGNRREGRRSSYGQYEAMHSQMPLTPISRPPGMPGGMQQMSPLALVTHAAAANNQQAQAAAAAAVAHRRLLSAPGFGQMPNLVTQEIENRMMEYLQLIQAKKEQSLTPIHPQQPQQQQPQQSHQQQQSQPSQQQHLHQQQQQQRQRSQSPEMSTREALSAQVALWHMYHNNSSSPGSAHNSPQQGEALNLSDSPPNLTNIKREREREPTPEHVDQDETPHQPPPAKRVGSGLMPPGFPANFYLNPHNMAAVAAAAGFHHQANSGAHHHHQHPDAVSEGEPEDDFGQAEHNTTGNSSTMHDDSEPQQLNGHHHHQNHLDKSDDSAIENSPSTSTTTASGGHRHSSPVSTKKKCSTKSQSGVKESSASGKSSVASNGKLNALETLSLLSSMQFQVARNGAGENGESQLTVNLELNGIKYSGVLVANVNPSDERTDASRGSETCQDKDDEQPHADSQNEDGADDDDEAREEDDDDEPAAVECSPAKEIALNEASHDQDIDATAIVNGGSNSVGVGVGVGVSLLKDAVVST